MPQSVFYSKAYYKFHDLKKKIKKIFKYFRQKIRLSQIKVSYFLNMCKRLVKKKITAFSIEKAGARGVLGEEHYFHPSEKRCQISISGTTGLGFN